MSAETRRWIALAVSLAAPGVPLIFLGLPGRGLAYFFGFWIAMVVCFPIAVFIYAAAFSDSLGQVN